MEEFFKTLDKSINEGLKTMQSLNTLERDLNNMYQTAIIADLISFIIFLLIVFFIYKNYAKNKELERKNKYLEYRVKQLENHIEETTGKKINNNFMYEF